MKVVCASFPSRAVDLLDPRVEDIDFGHIATHLSHIARFAGGTQTPFSVAEHSVAVMEAVSPPARPYALLHDAHEAFIGDLTKPFEIAIAAEMAKSGPLAKHFVDAVDAIRVRFDRVIFQAAGLQPYPGNAILDEVAAADADVGRQELLHRLHWPEPPGRGLAPPPIQSAPVARVKFIQALVWCCPHLQVD
jgi:hypothetical protein